MCSKNVKTKKTSVNWVKYFIFNLMFFGVLFAFQFAGGEKVGAVEISSYDVHQSNHKGNGNSYNSVEVSSSSYYDAWYIQGTGVSMKDVVTVTLKIPYHEINGIVAFETGYTGSGNKNYDSYKKSVEGVWSSLSDADYATLGGLAPGVVLDASSELCVSTFASAASVSTQLKANGGSYYSLMCIKEEKNTDPATMATDPGTITIQYAYTIRNAGYGQKEIIFALYNDSGYEYTPGGEVWADPMYADRFSVTFISSKPLDENQFTWVGKTDASGNVVKDACETNSSDSAAGRPVTENICVYYENGAKTTEQKLLSITLPKESAYIHDVAYETSGTDIVISSIKDNTIYGTNTFINFGTENSNKVVYYYYDFHLVGSVDATAGTYDTTGANVGMDPTKNYLIALMVDASGNYVFYITDVFGNSYYNTEVIDVEDVSKTNIIVDYTNAVALNIMTSTGAYDGGSWKQGWLFSITSPFEIDFTKMVNDQIVVEVYVFQKIVITNGVFGNNGTDGSDTTNIEDIAKQPLGYQDGDTNVPNEFDGDGVVIWRVKDISTDDAAGSLALTTNSVSCGTDLDKLCSASNIDYGSGDYSGGATIGYRNNKITFTIKSNGRYRIKITDNFGNTTDSLEGSAKNPKVEVSVIDRTAPVISSDLGVDTGKTNESSTSINTYPYVIGGGEVNPVNPDVNSLLSDADTSNDEYWKNTANYTTIYYNSKGQKIFNYQDALEIAQIKVVDSIEYYSGSSVQNIYPRYEVNFGYSTNQCFDVTTGSENKSSTAAGSYCDPTYNSKSNRNSSGTSYNLHNYIINNNFTSFSGGLVKQVGYTNYDGGTTEPYTQIDTAYIANAGVEFVNQKDATTFLGYLKIQFKTAGGAAEICTVTIDANDASGASNDANQACFELINKYIDDVENFQMVFSTRDYNSVEGHLSNLYAVNVTILDTTSPGIDMTGENADNSLNYSNEPTECRLEIDNLIQVKERILKCYKLKVGEVYKIKDNNLNHITSELILQGNAIKTDDGKQYYLGSGSDSYHEKIVMQVLERGTWMTIGDNDAATGFPHLYKSGYHQLKIEISDHWEDKSGITGTADNVLTIYVTYYVNPRTLLIEPLAGEKMYGEEEPLFDYCVYVNKANDTFNLEDHFFEKEFINEYFTSIYCSRDVYEKINDTTDVNIYTRTAGTVELGYAYHTYTAISSGAAWDSTSGNYFIKINNTYVKLESAKRYNMEYVQNNSGEYLLNDGTYHEIKSGYVYSDAACLYAAMGTETGTVYLRAGMRCLAIEESNRYTEKYTQNNSGSYVKYNLNVVSSAGFDNISDFNDVFDAADPITNANAALVNRNVFDGQLARVESRCYNSYAPNYYSNTEVSDFATLLNCNENSTDVDRGVRNDNVGQYHIVLGTLSIKEDGTSNYNEDYVIKINTNYIASNFSVGGATQTITNSVDNVLVDDGLYTESAVNYTIRQAVLTIRANGSTKAFGEQDPYSNNWNDTTTPTNIVTTGYLGGYTVSGWRYNGNYEDSTLVDNASNYIIEGTLRREIGEEVGIYDICNISGNPSDTTKLTVALCRDADVVTPSAYDTTHPYYFYAFDHYATDGSSSVAALTIRTNGNIYLTNASGEDSVKYAGRTLNRDTRNYAISFIKADFKIEATDLIVQPGINQGKEYAGSPYNDPLWQLVVYGETITYDTDAWVSNIEIDESSFSGYTANISVENNRREQVLGQDPYTYIYDTNLVAESEVYYSRRKVSPAESTYQYVDYINLTGRTTYAKSGEIYYESSTGSYIYAFGRYYEIKNSDRYNSSRTQTNDGTYLKVVVEGRLVNQTYSLFDENFTVTRSLGENVAWYSYDEIKNFKVVASPDVKVYTIRKVNNDNKECVIGENSVATSGGATNVDCRNYNVVYRDNAPTYDDALDIYETVEGDDDNIYAPNGINLCNSGFYSMTCGNSDNTTIKFEIFKREIILEFIDENYTFIYGERYEYYDGGNYSSNVYQYNGNSNGIFYINNTTSEGNIFLCYSDLGDYLVDCTSNADYGITSGDTWQSIGLKFYLHSVVSSEGSGYYYDASDKALPAGTYYVYADIAQLTGTDATTNNSRIKQNYKFTYRGGTLTIKPKVTNIQLTGYTMEYGESTYSSYGLGSDYSAYTSYKLAQCMNDVSYLVDDAGNVKTGLITDCTSMTDNVVGNKYGFVIEGLDSKDTIAENFNGRPVRASKNAANVGVFDDVGYYKITTGNIATKQNTNALFTQCITNLDAHGVLDTDKTNCVFVEDGTTGTGTFANARNYDITYSINNNEGAYLFILPADVEITVYENQVKMYGCAYSIFKTEAGEYYTYDYDTGYANCDASDNRNADFAYKYTVSGDKDTAKSYASVGSTYDVTTTQSGGRVFLTGGTQFTNNFPILTDDRLYRVTYSSANSYDYDYIKDNYAKYQGQKVGVYTISLGKLNIVNNSNSAMCDAYNNPALNGGSPCRNYNINYYGNSPTIDIDTHSYTDKTDVALGDLTLYTLNYQESSTGDYVLIDGKFVNLMDLDRYDSDLTTSNPSGAYALISKYVSVDSLTKYKKLTQYERTNVCSSDCYIYLKDSSVVDGTGAVIGNGYVLLSALGSYRYTDATGATQNETGDYLKVTGASGDSKYIALSTILKFKLNSSSYVADTNGAYVLINDEYVQLTSLQRYSEASGLYTKDATGTYVQIYEFAEIASLSRYKLDATGHAMYTETASTDRNKNLYVFVNGSYIPYNSLITSASQTVDSEIELNSANVSGSGVTRGEETDKVKFTIVSRIVYVHPEYNVKPYGENDPLEYMTCQEILEANGLTDFTGRSGNYCENAATDQVDLGVSMYYAVANSLAKAPWTAWTDFEDTGVQTRTTFNDIQFDVVTGKVSRKFDPTSVDPTDTNRKSDKAGKYTYDFGDVKTNDALSGNNYMIKYVTNYDLDATYVKEDGGSYVKLSEILFTTCYYGDAHCISTGGADAIDSNGNRTGKMLINNTYKIKATDGNYNTAGSSTSVSLVKKYSSASDSNPINYWYLGFYLNDDAPGRENELAKWWTSRTVFEEPYDELKLDNDANKNSSGTEVGFFTEAAKEVYFEIIKRTIYLYAVDVEKTYGEADKYSDFLVAICPNGLGYTQDGTNIKCASNTAESDAHGLSTVDASKFVNADGTMKQWQIKNNGVSTNSDYIFQGATDLQNSFGIYFRRTHGENAGSYTVTACAAQTGVTDCTHELVEVSPNYSINVLGDNYEIVEVSGTMTIKTREVSITPDSEQGFIYGNYTENGSMPNITFTEVRDGTGENGLVYGSGVYLFDGTTQKAKIERVQNTSDKYTSLYEFELDSVTYVIDGRKVLNKSSNVVVATIAVETTSGQNAKTVTIDGTTYSIIQKASCLINISGIYTTCISDAQNEALQNSLGENYYEYYTISGSTSVYTSAVLSSKVYDGARGNTDALREVTVSSNTVEYYSYNVYADSYSNPANEHTRKETNTVSNTLTENARNALNLKCGNTAGLRYSRDVCDYSIVSGELVAGTVLIEKETTFYIYVTNSKRYSYDAGSGEYSQSDAGTYVKYGNNLYAQIIESNMVSYVCESDGTKLVCQYKKDETAGATNNYLKVVKTSNNYRIKSVDETVVFSISAADITVTPIEKQYKIYGEADIEIKFDVETTYVVARTQYQNFANSNIVKICNGGTCYEGTALNAYRYGAIGATTANASGDYILLTKGWTVVLDSYAYDEENQANKSADLDYGVNRTKYKHEMTKDADDNDVIAEEALTHATTGLKHYDKYTTYNSTITTSRILIGNLYVENYDQTVGEKNIVNGLTVGLNKLAGDGNVGAKNYNLTFFTKWFVIVPRPVNVEIENITKIYGQATDADSFDNKYATEKIVGDGILIKDTGADDVLDPNEDVNNSLLINNFNVIDKGLADAIANATVSSGVLKAIVETAHYNDDAGTGGIEVVYMSATDDYSKMNMPTARSIALGSGTTYYNYVTVDVGHYYTATLDASTSKGLIERKNDTLNIKVQRGEYNIARNTSTCLADDSMLCEDVGEYYLSFTTRNAAQTKESTVENAYNNKYWGYNKNYYVIIYNNFEDSNWSSDEINNQSYQSISANTNIYYSSIIDEEGTRTYGSVAYTDDANPKASATLKIRKRAIEIVVETISEYQYEQNNNGTHLRVGTNVDDYKYYLITDTNRYIKNASGKYVQKSDGTYLCSYATANTDSNCYEIVSANRFDAYAKAVGEKYAIEENTDVPALVTVTNSKDVHHTTYDDVNYESITWYHHPLQVRTADQLTGTVAYCQETLTLGNGIGALNTLRALQTCGDSLHYYDANINDESKSNFFDTSEAGYYIITREKQKLYITNEDLTIATEADKWQYEYNNYTTTFVNGILQIDIDETPPVINIETDFIIKETNSGYMSKDAIPAADDVLGFLDALRTNGCASLISTRTEDGSTNVASTCDSGVIFTYEDSTNQPGGETPSVQYNSMKTILQWFGLSSFDPGIMRAGNPSGKRYHPRWYMAIQGDFNQKKVGDYSIFIYVQDDSGNISLASMVTLRLVDETAPTVGTLNLYNAKVSCISATNCGVEDNWVVAEDVYLPINTLTKENLDNMKAADKANKYSFSGKTLVGGVYVSTYTPNQYFGTYYKITAGTSAKAVKHTGWSNTSAGIYMTITGGDDNSLAYLDTSGYTKYNVAGTTITTSASGTHLLLGSFVNVANLTKYRAVGLDVNGDEVDDIDDAESIVYLPDKTGTIIRYKGYYFDLRSGSYIDGTPSAEHAVKLYSHTGTTYTEASSMPETIPEGTTYYLRDGDMYEIPSEKYNASGQHDSTGTYVNFQQWNHYYSRDGGNSWIKYDRDTTSGYLALGQDGQRLIMIKAIDNGYTFAEAEVDKDHVIDAYCKTVGNMTCQIWNNIAVGGVTIKDDSGTAISYKEYAGSKVWKYNISAWEDYSDDGNRDRKYAYLDTIIPNTTLSDQFIEVFEYGCADISKCSVNHVEMFGTAIDGYLFKLDKLIKYNNAGQVTDGGDYVRVGNELILVESLRRFNIDPTTKVITQSNSGAYIYLGKTDSVTAIDTLISEKVADRIAGDINVYNQYTKAQATFTVATSVTGSEEVAEKLQNNTNKLQSGVGLGDILYDASSNPIGADLFSGVGNEERTFGVTIDGATVSDAQIADKYTNIFVYADIRGGTGAVEGNPYYSQQGYYKFVISYSDSDSGYKVYGCYLSSTVPTEFTWCSEGSSNYSVSTLTFTNTREAMNSLLSVYAETSAGNPENRYNFKGNELTFTLDYRVYDIAGNVSVYERKGILFSGFTRTIGVANPTGVALMSYAIDVGQNTNVASALSDFEITTTTGKSLRNNERILQTVYYNGILVSSRKAYDLSMFEDLDTTVPGVYRIVYSIERKDGMAYVVGNSVELTVTVKPDVAIVSTNNINYINIILVSGSVITVGLAMLFVELKRRQKQR